MIVISKCNFKIINKLQLCVELFFFFFSFINYKYTNTRSFTEYEFQWGGRGTVSFMLFFFAVAIHFQCIGTPIPIGPFHCSLFYLPCIKDIWQSKREFITLLYYFFSVLFFVCFVHAFLLLISTEDEHRILFLCCFVQRLGIDFVYKIQ